jgi:hypothetical protein
LADDLVDRGEGNSGFQRQAERDGIAIANVFRDRVVERMSLIRQR